jgi:hypothetical protein
MEHYIREIKYYKSSKLFNPDTIVALEDLWGIEVIVS